MNRYGDKGMSISVSEAAVAGPLDLAVLCIPAPACPVAPEEYGQVGATTAIALHLETDVDRPALSAAVGRTALAKAAAVLVVDKNDVSKLAHSHTAALATSWRTARAMLCRVSAVVDDVGEACHRAAETRISLVVGPHALGVALYALAEDADLRHEVTEDLQAACQALRVAAAAQGPRMPQPELPEPPATDLHDTLAMATPTSPLVHSIEVPQGALAVVLASLTRLLEDDPTVCDVEINPLRVTDEGLVALDAVVCTTTPADAILPRSTT